MNPVFEIAKGNKFKHKHFSQEKIDTISQSNLIQLTYWIDETLIEERNNRFYLSTEENLVINYILTLDKLTNSPDKNYALKRVIAYLCDTRCIDKDIVLNFIKQGFIKMDGANNLCFITYADPTAKSEVTAIAKRGTLTERTYKGNFTKEHNEGFFYARAADLREANYRTAFVFESVIDLLSYLTLAKRGYIDQPESGYCCLSLNGAGNRAYLHKVLERCPSIGEVKLCLDNDAKGIEAARCIASELAGTVEVEDVQPLLKAISRCNRYCKDWNDAARLAAEVGEIKIA